MGRSGSYRGKVYTFVVIGDGLAPFEVVCNSMEVSRIVRSLLNSKNPLWREAIVYRTREDGTEVSGTLYNSNPKERFL